MEIEILREREGERLKLFLKFDFYLYIFYILPVSSVFGIIIIIILLIYILLVYIRYTYISFKLY